MRGDRMPSITDFTCSIDKDVANAVVTVNYKLVWTPFEQLTNLEFDETWKLIGDDTGEDGDNNPAGDDPIVMGLMFIEKVSSNGQATTQRTKTKTIAWGNLNEDNMAGAEDDEIRAVVTLTPRMPAVTSRESNKVVVNA